ncbi:benzoate-CoA ligase family protein [Spectribacter hydrogenoxidans]|uniref:Benzoate-CoA ligase family protein n=1 Tax=Spectribacter hydrogenoxidans TaxID=3075608 RepID=A0ABU3C2V1_9GAMM|nr:benzoate-CoA ligase family protein [Salinisphaera sp. W335]MDT0635674.1 benzoate-CoA ligase family protein [Salinisphaera sp. W335]
MTQGFAGVHPPRDYNAATDFIDRHGREGHGGRTAIIDADGPVSYDELTELVNRAGNALLALGLRQESRVAMIMHDSRRFPAVFWGAIKAGIIPIPINTLLRTSDYRHILTDCRARVLVVSEPLLDEVRPALAEQPFLDTVIVDGQPGRDEQSLADLLAAAGSDLEPAPTTADDVAFWLYSSGSTGTPKGVLHLHRHLPATAECYGRGVLGIEPEDVIFSAAKLFFAYGLGNGMTFPFAIGATAVYLPGRPAPDAVMAVLREHQPTIFGGVPTLYAAILADDANNRDSASPVLRRCISAGEALPKEVGERWQARFGAEVLDGVGSTEMLHIFLSNRPGRVCYGTSGEPVPGYSVRLVDESDHEVGQEEIGELLVNGPSACTGYWNRRDKSLDTFQGHWTRTGDKYYRDAEGCYHYCGRTDDMFKVSGQWVSPFEVESALIAHDQVLEAAVVPHDEGDNLLKPRAFVVLKNGCTASDDLAAELQGFVKARIATVKYPRWIDFLDELPKTATGKIQRFKLRA